MIRGTVEISVFLVYTRAIFEKELLAAEAKKRRVKESVARPGGRSTGGQLSRGNFQPYFRCLIIEVTDEVIIRDPLHYNLQL